MMYQNIPQIPNVFLGLFPTNLQSLIETEELLKELTNIAQMRDYIKQRLELRYSCHASSTHSLLYAEYCMMSRVLHQLDSQSSDYRTMEFYFRGIIDVWKCTVCQASKSKPLSKYINYWGHLPYIPLSQELQDIQRLISLKIDFGNFQRLLSVLKKDYYSRSFLFRRAEFSKEDAKQVWSCSLPATLVAPLSEEYYKSGVFLGSDFLP